MEKPKRWYPFIVGELSCNHRGSLERALDTVEAVADAGVDAIKLQTWAPGTMVLDPALELKSGPWAGRKMTELYEEAHTPWDWHYPIFRKAAECGIEAFSSVFDLEALAFLEGLECPRYKIASFELVDLPLIEAVAKTGKPVILSTGMATVDEIDMAVHVARSAGCESLTLLKCTSAYPANPDTSNLAAMSFLSKRFGYARTGLSDHTQGIGCAIVAAGLGAKMIEKHVTLKREDGDLDGPFSVEPHELAKMVLECHRVRKALGSPGEAFKEREEEAPQRALRRSLHFRGCVLAGQQITADKLTTARPAHGLAPKFAEQVIGATAQRDVYPGEPVTWRNVQRKESPGAGLIKKLRANT